jgi:putative FmdB family regulatory protein
MPIFVYRCDCGFRFERLVARDSAAPACPECDGATHKMPAGPRLARGGGGSAGAGDVPIPWRGTVSGGPEKMQREIGLRQNLLAKGGEQKASQGSTD